MGLLLCELAEKGLEVWFKRHLNIISQDINGIQGHFTQLSSLSTSPISRFLGPVLKHSTSPVSFSIFKVTISLQNLNTCSHINWKLHKCLGSNHTPTPHIPQICLLAPYPFKWFAVPGPTNNIIVGAIVLYEGYTNNSLQLTFLLVVSPESVQIDMLCSFHGWKTVKDMDIPCKKSLIHWHLDCFQLFLFFCHCKKFYTKYTLNIELAQWHEYF